MKKINLFILTASIMALLTGLFAGCNSSNNSDYTTTDSGLQYKDLLVGEGEEVKVGNTLSMHYTGKLEDGTVFDSSVERGTPFTFDLGEGQVIAGWDEGVQGMRVGGKRELVIPFDLAYGENGIPGVIPGSATLIFEVEVLEIL